VQDYAIFALDRTGRILTWSAGAARLKGYARTEVIGQHLSIFYPPEDVKAGKPERELEIAAREGRHEDEGWRVRKDGTRFWANVVITALRDEMGTLVGFAKVTRDLTERRHSSEALRQSEERFRLLVESVRDYAIFMLDPDGHVASWNAGAERIKGYRAEEIVGRHFSIFYPEDKVAEGFPQHELEVAAREGRFEDEGWRIRKDGSRFWANVVITALRNGEGALVGFAKVTRDLTDRRAAEEQARRLAAEEAAHAEAERRSEELRLLGDQLQNQAIELEQQTEEAQSLAEELEQSNEELYQTLIEANQAREAERGARAEADNARTRLTQVFEQAPVAVAVVRGRVARELVYEVVNRRYMEIIPPGRQPLGRRLVDVLPEMDERLLDTLQDVLDTGEPFVANEFAASLDRDNDGTPETYYFNFVYQPLVEGDGSVSGVVGIGTEVTDSVRGRQEAERLREVAEQARVDAEAASRAKTEFLTMMSHELRTPLNAIAGYTQLLEMGLRGPVTEQQREDLGRIERSQLHLTRLISEVLNYARLESGVVTYDLQPTLMADIVAAAAPLVEPQRAAKNLALDVRLPELTGRPPLYVLADREKLQQILLNLLSNAVKFTPQGGRVTVELLDEPNEREMAVLHVADTGVGIPDDKLEAIFEPFVQIGRSLSSPSEGTGLGLSISRDLARGMGGDLTAESAPGTGSTFTLTLRRA
jgi:PAS domain S-box-containing protein